MNRIVPFLAILLIFSCKEAKKSETAETEVETTEGPLQWLTIKGGANGKNVVLISGDEEYRSEESMPQLAKILAEHHGFNCTVLFAQDPAQPG